MPRLVLRSALLPVAALCLQACAATPQATGAALPLESFTFLIRDGDAVVARERVRVFADRFEAEIEVPGQAHANYVAWYGAAGAIARIDVVFRPAAGAPPTDGQSVVFAGDSVRVERAIHATIPRAYEAGAGAVPYLHPSPMLLQRIVTSAMERGAEAAVPVWLVASGNRTSAQVRFDSPEIAIVRMAGTELRVWLLDGRVIGGEVPSIGWIFQRVDGEAGAAAPPPQL
jgi:hypothetical protein